MLFAIDPRQRLRVFGAGVPLNPGKGWSLVYLNGLGSADSGQTSASASGS